MIDVNNFKNREKWKKLKTYKTDTNRIEATVINLLKKKNNIGLNCFIGVCMCLVNQSCPTI